MYEKRISLKLQCKILLVILSIILAGLLFVINTQTVWAAEDELISEFYYAQQYEGVKHPEEEIQIDVIDFKCNVLGGAELYQNREGSIEGIAIAEETCTVTFNTYIPETGMYNMELTYYPLGDRTATIIFGVLIDGKAPYIEANTCILSRVFQNGEIRQDEQGNDIRPKSEQISEWKTQFLCEQTGVAGTLSFYLEKGDHEISLCFDETPLLIESLNIKQEPYKLNYQDYISLLKQQGFKAAEGVLDIFQAENYLKQSNSELWPNYDRTSVLTQPFEYETKKINYGGGSRWNVPGQWISWSFTVPEDGLYNIGVKYRQNYLDGLFSSREVSIDGEVPFEEMKAVRFAYTDSWENLLLGNGEDPYLIYLTAGEHVITMKNVLGDMKATLDVMQTCISNLNELYLSIIMITSSEPDQYRDYFLKKQLPDLPQSFRENAAMLFEEAENLIKIVGNKGEASAFLEDIAYNLETYAEDIEALTNKGRISDLKNDITSLSSKMTEIQNQALDIDYIALLSNDQKMPRSKETIWEWIKFQLELFKASFQQEEQESTSDTIRVWINTGSDQLQIIQDMISDEFTPNTGIEVDLELVQGTLIQATAAKNGPDVAINIDGDSVVNLALRGALVDLTEMEGYPELVAEYVEGSTIPYTVEGKVFAIPNSGVFSVMFVRTDIFEQLGLDVPSTWEEMYDVAQVIQRNNMTLGTVPGFATLLYQKGGTYFDEGLTKVLFDEDVAVEAFTQYTEFYTKYGFPITFDFVSRFRTGEMPIGIASYSTYNTLKYSAPEISGLWAMYPIPGTIRDDGSFDATQAISSISGATMVTNTATITTSAGTGTIMFEQTDNQNAAWEFIKWWSGTEAQTRYANDLEAVMGVAARYNTLNPDVMENIGWTKAELKVLQEQMKMIEYVPIIPGNYYVTRGVENTYRGVVNEAENVRELLVNWTTRINEEITRKRKEFFDNN